MSEKALRKGETDAAVAPQVAPAPAAAGPASPAPLAGLVVGSATDPAEAAADAMATTALSRVAAPGADPHQHGPGCDHVRRTAAPSAAPTIGLAGGALDPGSARSITGRRGQGDRLPEHTLQQMESGFGRSFSSVRVHTDGAAAGLAAGMSAAAFTTGNDVFFGAGQFRPGTPDGDHMIAHELAHVVQDSGTVHRSILDRIGKAVGLVEKTDDEKATDAAAALAKKQKKDQKAADKAAQKKEAAENKEKAGQHKELEKSHQAGQKADRVVGMASRAGTAGGISSEVADNEAAGKGKTSQKAIDLHVEFETWLDTESDLFVALLGQGLDDEKARDKAYKQTWLIDAPEHIKAVRPPRETAAERLSSAVKDARRQDAAETDKENRGALGSLLSKKVEMVYERAETEFDKLVERHPDQAPDFLRQAVEVTIWAKAPADIRDKRPTDQKIEMKAREDARKRLNLRPTPAASKKAPDSMWDKHQSNAGMVETGTGVLDKVGKGTSLVLKQVGKPKDKVLQAGDPKSDDPVAATVAEKIPGPIGGFSKEVRSVQNRMAKDQKDDKPDPVKATSDETKAAAGIGAVTGILTGLMSTVQGIMTSCKAIAKAHEERTARNILAATKASSDAVKSAAGTAKGIASFAGSFDAGVQNAVASFIPGLNIGIAALGLISNGCDLADVAMRMHETNNAVFDTRLRGMSGGGADGPDVLIFPLLKVAATYTKKVEQASWSTGVSVSDLATSIATVASGGGYGIPVAVQAGVKVVDLLHSLGHLVADEVLARISQKSRTDATASLEGSAEQQLKNDPSMAIDSLIVQARKGDAIAIKFVTGYDIKPAELQSGKLSELRGKMLGTMGLDADPLTMYQKFKKGMASVKSAAGDVSDKFTATGQMAAERNAMDGKTRGFGWRVKMMFKGQVKFTRSVNKTQTLTGRKLGEKESDAPVFGPQNREALVFIGTFALPLNPTDQEVETFLAAAKGFPDSALTQALSDKRNTLQEAQDTLLYIIADKAALAASA